MPRSSTPVLCSGCKKSSDEANVWFPSPVTSSFDAYDAEMERLKKYAKCEYCMFGVPYVNLFGEVENEAAPGGGTPT